MIPHMTERQRYNKNRERLAAVKRDTPCADCGTNYPPEAMIVKRLRGEGPQLNHCGDERFQREMNDHDVLCLNCNALRKPTTVT
jgi:hypothetical protein